jgi:hypothetical protein
MLVFCLPHGISRADDRKSVEEIVKRLQKNEPDRYNSILAERSLTPLIARVYLAAYAAGPRVPTEDGSPDFYTWAGIHRGELPKISPRASERKKYLEQAIMTYRKIKGELDPWEDLELAWCLVQNEERAEARALLKKHVGKIGDFQYFKILAPDAYFSIPLPVGAKTFSFSVNDKSVIEQNIFVQEIYNLIVNARSRNGEEISLEWKKLASAYLADPSDMNYENLVKKGNAGITEITSKLPQAELGINKDYFLEFLKVRHENGKKFNEKAGRLEVRIYPTPGAKVGIDSISFSGVVTPKLAYAGDRHLNFKKEKVTLTIKDSSGKLIDSVATDMEVLPSFEAESAPASFNLEEYYKDGRNGRILKLYMETLDSKKDDLEIKSLKQAAWKESQLSKWIPSYEGIVPVSYDEQSCQ